MTLHCSERTKKRRKKTVYHPSHAQRRQHHPSLPPYAMVPKAASKPTSKTPSGGPPPPHSLPQHLIHSRTATINRTTHSRRQNNPLHPNTLHPNPCLASARQLKVPKTHPHNRPAGLVVVRGSALLHLHDLGAVRGGLFLVFLVVGETEDARILDGEALEVAEFAL